MIRKQNVEKKPNNPNTSHADKQMEKVNKLDLQDLKVLRVRVRDTLIRRQMSFAMKGKSKQNCNLFLWENITEIKRRYQRYSTMSTEFLEKKLDTRKHKSIDLTSGRVKCGTH